MVTLRPSTKPTSPRPLWNPTMRSAHCAAATPCNTPMTGIADCSACVANDQKVAAPAAVLKKSRRRIACPEVRGTPRVADYISDLGPAKHIRGATECDIKRRTMARRISPTNVRFGSKADIRACPGDVRFTPKADID